VLGSVLALLAVTAAVLLVPALVGLLGVERHRHLAETEDTTRRLRLVLAATLVGLASLMVVAQAGGEVPTASAVAVVLAGSVLVWAPLTRLWAVRGVVVWALLVSGAVGFLGWLAHTLATSSLSAAELLAGGAVWLLLLLVLARLQRYVRAALAGRAGLLPGASTASTPLVRPAVSLAALLAASGVVVAVASGDGGPVQEGRPPEAGLPGSPTTSGVPTQPLPSPSASTRTSGPGQPTAAMAGVVGVPWSPASLVAGVAVARSAPSERGVAPTCLKGGAQGPVSGAGGPASGVAAPQPAGGLVPTVGSTPKSAKPTSRPPKGSSSPSPSPLPGPGTQTPGSGPGDAPGANPTVRPTPLLPSKPATSPTAALTRLLGFEKEKPNRPAKAPSPGHGRPDHARAPVLPTPGPSGPPPSGARVPTSASVTPDQPVPKASRTPGYEKEKPNRPAHVPSPGHGRPSPS
jgi:hypothetical protein